MLPPAPRVCLQPAGGVNFSPRGWIGISFFLCSLEACDSHQPPLPTAPQLPSLSVCLLKRNLRSPEFTKPLLRLEQSDREL